MKDYSEFFAFLRMTALEDVAGLFESLTQEKLRSLSHGDFERWAAAIKNMPKALPSHINLDTDAVTVAGDIDEHTREQLKNQLMQLHPWRKGPFELFGIGIDTEWRSDLKWARLKNHIDLRDKFILDIGCGNGYYLYRMLGAGAKAVVGVDPFMLYVMQFQAVNKYIRTNRAAVLPLGLDDLPADCGCFDCVFSMGVLYHRRNAQQHPAELLGFLKPGGQLILETIVLDKPGEELLVPDGRYAKMRNVWAIPTPALLEKWIADAGYRNIETVDITQTTPAEQRRTDWMTFESLPDYLDPDDTSKTTEGYPAPVRAVITAQKP